MHFELGSDRSDRLRLNLFKRILNKFTKSYFCCRFNYALNAYLMHSCSMDLLLQPFPISHKSLSIILLS